MIDDNEILPEVENLEEFVIKDGETTYSYFPETDTMFLDYYDKNNELCTVCLFDGDNFYYFEDVIGVLAPSEEKTKQYLNIFRKYKKEIINNDNL